MESPVDKADRLSRRRMRMLFFIAIVLVTQQASFDRMLEYSGGPLRTVEIVALTAWVVVVIAALAALATGGMYFQSREVRHLMDDELSKANRARALATGFLVTIPTAVVVFVASFFRDISAPEAIHAIVTLGLACSLLRFFALERRDHASG